MKECRKRKILIFIGLINEIVVILNDEKVSVLIDIGLLVFIFSE